MSNNRSQPGLSGLPFLAVEYEDKKAVISQNTNYQETLASIKQVFSALRNAQNEDIGINSQIKELDDCFRIAPDLWPELMPRLMSVKLTLDPPAQSNNAVERPLKFSGLGEQKINEGG